MRVLPLYLKACFIDVVRPEFYLAVITGRFFYFLVYHSGTWVLGIMAS